MSKRRGHERGERDVARRIEGRRTEKPRGDSRIAVRQ